MLINPSTLSRLNWRRAAPFIALMAVVGGIFVALSFAAGPLAAFEPESGILAGAAVSTAVSGASGGQVVTFAAAATPTPTPTPAATPTGSVTNGTQINMTNTGYLAWRGASGQTCTDATLTVYTSQVNASSLGATASCVWLKQGINIDADITLNACRVDVPVSTYPQHKHINLNYCTINPTSPGDWSLGDGNFTATRSQIMGSSDGVRYAGSTADTLIENYIRTRAQSSDDHNDGIQMYGADGGGIMLRNNIDNRPIGGGGGINGTIFVADGATGTYEIRDNYLLGGNWSLRLHENGYYRVTGNIVEKNSYLYGPANTTNARAGAFLEWSNNKLSDGTTFTQ